jgi:hypothetical protein
MITNYLFEPLTNPVNIFCPHDSIHHCDWTEGAPRLSAPNAPGAGLFFCRRLRSHAPMDPDLENVIRQALADAQAAGRDHVG